MDNGRFIALLSLYDISAAFDTVDDAILLDRLSESLWITDSALLWFQSFLTDSTVSVILVTPVLPWFTSFMAYPRVRSLFSFYSFFKPQIYQGSWVHWVSHATNMLMIQRLTCTFMVLLPQLLIWLGIFYRRLMLFIDD